LQRRRTRRAPNSTAGPFCQYCHFRILIPNLDSCEMDFDGLIDVTNFKISKFYVCYWMHTIKSYSGYSQGKGKFPLLTPCATLYVPINGNHSGYNLLHSTTVLDLFFKKLLHQNLQRLNLNGCRLRIWTGLLIHEIVWYHRCIMDRTTRYPTDHAVRLYTNKLIYQKLTMVTNKSQQKVFVLVHTNVWKQWNTAAGNLP